MAKEKLAPYEVPKEIVIRKELPLTSVGKLDRSSSGKTRNVGNSAPAGGSTARRASIAYLI